MNVLRLGANMIERASPTGLILAGTVLALTSPPVRRGLRSVAVMTARGVLAATDTLQNTVTTLRSSLEDIVIEAKTPVEQLEDMDAASPSLFSAAKSKGRRMAVTAAVGALTARKVARNIMAEAKGQQLTTNPDDDESLVTNGGGLHLDGLEASKVEITQDSVRKKRSQAKPL